MYVEDAIAELLRSDPVAGIDFDLNGLRIDGAGFARIADLIAEGHIQIRIEPDLCAGAQYDPSYDSPNTLTLRSARISDRYVQAYAVHEATHALCDLVRARGYVYVEESAAFLAEVIFARRLSPPLNLRRWPRRQRTPLICRRGRVRARIRLNRIRRQSGRPEIPRERPFNLGAQRRIHNAATALVDRYHLDQAMEGNRRRPALTWNAFAALRNAVASTETYELIHSPRTPGGPFYRYTNDGIRREPGVRPAHEHEAR